MEQETESLELLKKGDITRESVYNRFFEMLYNNFKFEEGVIINIKENGIIIVRDKNRKERILHKWE